MATGKWSEEEHDRFKHAIETYGKDWKKVTEAVGTRNVTQVRSHAQKYFDKVQKQAKIKNFQQSPKPLLTDFPPDPITASMNYSALYQAWLYHTMNAARYYQLLTNLGSQRPEPRANTPGRPKKDAQLNDLQSN